jgi:DNA mismatch endonuclease (patch repair protein)
VSDDRRPFKRSPSPTKSSSRLETTTATSARMGRIRRTGTTPELAVRKVFAAHGLRYRLNNRDLPGAPDLANRGKRWAVFVHGCFWHRHEGCSRSTTPKSNAAFWISKFQDNVMRDQTAVRSLRDMGFQVAVIWECEVAASASQVARRFHSRRMSMAKRTCRNR